MLIVCTLAFRKGIRPDVLEDVGTLGSDAFKGGHGGFVRARGDLEYPFYMCSRPVISLNHFSPATLHNNASINETTGEETPLQ